MSQKNSFLIVIKKYSIMSKVKIYGNPNPVIGIKEYYSIHDFFGSSASSQTAEPQFQNTPDGNIKWSVWILLGKSWVKMSKNNKTGATVDYTFTQISLKRKGIRMLVDANGEKAILDIETKNTEERKILHVEILDWSKKKPAKLFSYGEKITARVHCLNMEKFPITVTLWEDDGGKKDLSDISIESKEVNVLNGKADVEFAFDPGKVWLANAKSEPNESNEGAFHEYYVTAEFYKKVSKPTENVNVINPDYKEDIFAKVPVSKPSEPEKKSPAAQKGPSKKETRGISKTDRKADDYQEQKVVVKPTVVFNPQQEFINSLMMVDVGDSIWHQNKCVCKDYDLVWGNKIGCDERKKVSEVSKALGIDPNWLMTVMALETNKTFSPSIDNGIGYVGLIQFGENATHDLNTTQEKLVKMTFIEQMDYVQKHLIYVKNHFVAQKKYETLTDLYLAVLYPSVSGHGKELNRIVLSGAAYRNNPLFFKENGEWEWATKLNNHGKEIKYKKATNPDGNTYVWEIAMVAKEVYTEGLFLKETAFICKKETYIENKGECLQTWDAVTNSRIDKLHPKIKCAVKNFVNDVEKTMGIKLRVIQGYRTYAEQDALFRQRPKVTNARGGESNHNFGLAIDVAEIKNGTIDWEEQETVLSKIAPIGKKWGLAWGGDWKSFVDKPHFEMTFGKTTQDLRELLEIHNDYTKIPL